MEVREIARVLRPGAGCSSATSGTRAGKALNWQV